MRNLSIAIFLSGLMGLLFVVFKPQAYGVSVSTIERSAGSMKLPLVFDSDCGDCVVYTVLLTDADGMPINYCCEEALFVRDNYEFGDTIR